LGRGAIVWIAAAVFLNSDGLGLIQPRWKSAPIVYPITVHGPNGLVVGFPEGLDKATIERAMEEVSKLPPPPAGFVVDGASFTLTPDQRRAVENARTRRRVVALLTVFAPPLVLLLAGVGLGWIIRGFSPKPKTG
jgi:hypothetical protein